MNLPSEAEHCTAANDAARERERATPVFATPACGADYFGAGVAAAAVGTLW